MTYGEILPFMKSGYPVYRDSWKSGLFVIKQIDSDIDAVTVPKMQSLPPKAKKIVSSTGDGCIHYRNQCLIIDTDHSSGSTVATNYIPDWNDTFANDWNIFDQSHSV